MYTPRPYQYDCVKAVKDSCADFDKVLVVMATGLGKTVVFNLLAYMVAQKNFRTLILAHTDALVGQTADRIPLEVGITPSIEKAELYGDLESMIVVASVQSLSKDKRLERYPEDHFQFVVVDEAHRSLAASYLKVLSRFPKAKVMGATATPNRGDKRELSELFETVAYEYPLDKAIADGWLCPVVVRSLHLRIDVSGVKT